MRHHTIIAAFHDLGAVSHGTRAPIGLADIALFAWTRPTDLVQAPTSRAKMYRQKQATELTTNFPEPIRSILNTKAPMTAFNLDLAAMASHVGILYALGYLSLRQFVDLGR
jgi:hypothetical protein